MTGVPLSYQAEPGSSRCGNSFTRSIMVTGELPGRNGFGADIKRSLPRVAVVPGGSWWSRRSPAELGFRDQVLTSLGYTEADLRQYGQTQLTTAQENGVEWLLELARGNLERVDAIYAYWRGSGAHPVTGQRLPVDQNAPSPIGSGTYARASEWPLEVSDAIYEYMPECAGKNASWVEDRELIGNTVRKVRLYFCPGNDTREQRAIDRATILELLLDAARAVRCARYGIWRIVLYRRALEQWNDRYGDLPTFQGGGGGGATPRPGTQAGGGFGVYVPPREPPGPTGGSPWQTGGSGPVRPLPTAPLDWPIPDPGDLPDPGPLGEGGPGGGTQTEDGGGSLLPRLPAGALPLVIAGGAVAAYLFLQNTR